MHPIANYPIKVGKKTIQPNEVIPSGAIPPRVLHAMIQQNRVRLEELPLLSRKELIEICEEHNLGTTGSAKSLQDRLLTNGINPHLRE